MVSPRIRTVSKWGLAILGAAVALLSWPESYPPLPEHPGGTAFEWDADARFEALEDRFREAKRQCPVESGELTALIGELSRDRPGPDDIRWETAQEAFFEKAVDYARCPEQVAQLIELRRRLRIAAKDASLGWEGATARARLYRLLYGTRIAVEQVLTQLPAGTAPAKSLGRSVASQAPSAEIEGVTVHSGDLLLSRGGAPTSAFIARGSDFPGNFSHVALVHIDEESGAVSIVESHIEMGVVISTPADYLRDKKLRIQLLRLRAEHPMLRQDPLVAHHAASAAMQDTTARHIPYDFSMDATDPSKQFCSEVASSAYASQGIELWKEMTRFSNAGLARWMSGFGVEHLGTHGPSDLEYDTALHVVAEWHDPDAVLEAQLDNAVIDALLESAEGGRELGHDAWLLPLARLAKGYSLLQNWMGNVGPVPEGMSATVALRAKWLEEVHGAAKAELRAKVVPFQDARGYTPPYWELVRMAREVVEAE